MNTIYIYSYFPSLEKEYLQKWIDHNIILHSNPFFVILTHSSSFDFHLPSLSYKILYIPPQIEPFLSYSIVEKMIQFTLSSSYLPFSSSGFLKNSIENSKNNCIIDYQSSSCFNSKLQSYYQLFIEHKEKDKYQISSFINQPSYSLPQKYLLCYMFGGLGNMLFQVSSALALSIEYNLQLVIPYDPNYIENYRAPTFRFSCNHYSIFNHICRIRKDLLPSNLINYHEPNIQYQPNLYEFMNHTKESNQPLSLIGYFQSTKYFKKYWKIIQKYFLNLTLQEVCKECIFQLRLSKSLFHKKIISIHIRGTDYLKHSDHYVILTPQYYQNIIENILFQKYKKEDCHFFIFTDDKDYVQSHFSFLFSSSYSTSFIQDIINENSSLEKIKKNDEFELMLMSQFDILICANSSYSLFSSYLSESDEIYIPNQWTKQESNPEFIQNFILNPNTYFPSQVYF